MTDKEQRARIFSAAARETGSGHARLELFRALDGVTLYYVGSKTEVDGQPVVSTRLRRLDDGSSAMVVYTSRRHPDLPDRFLAAKWSDILRTAYETVRPDWLVIANMRNETVPISRDQIPVILADLSVPEADRIPDPVVVEGDLESAISGAAGTDSEHWYEPVMTQLCGREIYLHLADSADGSPIMVTSPAAGRDGWVLTYTTRNRPGIRYGGIKWEQLVDMIKNNPAIPGVRVVNDADDWVLLGRDVIEAPAPVAANSGIDASQALTLFLKHYPGSNDAEFDEFFGPDHAPAARALVRRLLDEAMSIRPDWSRMTLNDAGDYVEAEMHARHPDLSPKALECIGNYYTYLMR